MHTSNHTKLLRKYVTRKKKHTHNNTSAQRILSGIYRLLVTNKGGSAFTSAHSCQGQLKTPQSVSLKLSMSLMTYQEINTQGRMDV
jgi:hypothetical protein